MELTGSQKVNRNNDELKRRMTISVKNESGKSLPDLDLPRFCPGPRRFPEHLEFKDSVVYHPLCFCGIDISRERNGPLERRVRSLAVDVMNLLVLFPRLLLCPDAPAVIVDLDLDNLLRKARELGVDDIMISFMSGGEICGAVTERRQYAVCMKRPYGSA